MRRRLPAINMTTTRKGAAAMPLMTATTMSNLIGLIARRLSAVPRGEWWQPRTQLRGHPRHHRGLLGGGGAGPGHPGVTADHAGATRGDPDRQGAGPVRSGCEAEPRSRILALSAVAALAAAVLADGTRPHPPVVDALQRKEPDPWPACIASRSPLSPSRAPTSGGFCGPASTPSSSS